MRAFQSIADPNCELVEIDLNWNLDAGTGSIRSIDSFLDTGTGTGSFLVMAMTDSSF